MAIVPWGVVVSGDTERRILRWPAVRSVHVQQEHELRGGTPSIVESIVTVETERESLVGRVRGAAGLERLVAGLERYAEEASRPVSFDLAGEEAVEEGVTEPVAELLLRRAREGRDVHARRLRPRSAHRGLSRCGARAAATPATVVRLRELLDEDLRRSADPRPLAALLAAVLGARELVPELLRLTASPHPFVAASAKAAALRLGAPPNRAGSLDELSAFLFDDDHAAPRGLGPPGWARPKLRRLSGAWYGVERTMTWRTAAPTRVLGALLLGLLAGCAEPAALGATSRPEHGPPDAEPCAIVCSGGLVACHRRERGCVSARVAALRPRPLASRTGRPPRGSSMACLRRSAPRRSRATCGHARPSRWAIPRAPGSCSRASPPRCPSSPMTSPNTTRRPRSRRAPMPDAAAYFEQRGRASDLARAARARFLAGDTKAAQALLSRALPLARAHPRRGRGAVPRTPSAPSCSRPMARPRSRSGERVALALSAPASDEGRAARRWLEEKGHPLSPTQQLTLAGGLVEAGAASEAVAILARLEGAKGLRRAALVEARARALYRARVYPRGSESLSRRGGARSRARAGAALRERAGRLREQARKKRPSGCSRALGKGKGELAARAQLPGRASRLAARSLRGRAQRVCPLSRAFSPRARAAPTRRTRGALATLSAGDAVAARKLFSDQAAKAARDDAARLRQLEGLAASRAGDRGRRVGDLDRARPDRAAHVGRRPRAHALAGGRRVAAAAPACGPAGRGFASRRGGAAGRSPAGLRGPRPRRGALPLGPRSGRHRGPHGSGRGGPVRRLRRPRACAPVVIASVCAR
jgi:hypothetical protein